MDSLSGFKLGQRVRAHPCTDQFMMGYNYGTITKIGNVWVHVKFDINGRTLKFTPKHLLVSA